MRNNSHIKKFCVKGDDILPDTDLRVQRTKKLLKEQFKEMFLEMDYEKITIKELCERAMINRRTFYLHYNSIDDVLNEVLDEMAHDFLEYTKDYDHFLNSKRIVKDYFLFTSSSPLFEKLNNNVDYNYLRESVNTRVRDIAKDNFSSVYKFDKFKIMMMMTYLNSATVNMYRIWCLNGKPVPIEDAIEIAGNLIENGLKNNM